jgi:hypothetical protein
VLTVPALAALTFLASASKQKYSASTVHTPSSATPRVWKRQNDERVSLSRTARMAWKVSVRTSSPAFFLR